MASLKFSEWHGAVKAGVAVCGTFGAIIGIYLAVDAWAEDKITASERRMIEERAEEQALNEIAHDKIYQSQRIETAQTNITITELKMEHLEEEVAEREEEGLEPTERQRRQMDRLIKQLELYESVEDDATTKLTITTRTTTTTTTTTENPDGT